MPGTRPIADPSAWHDTFGGGAPRSNPGLATTRTTATTQDPRQPDSRTDWSCMRHRRDRTKVPLDRDFLAGQAADPLPALHFPLPAGRNPKHNPTTRIGFSDNILIQSKVLHDTPSTLVHVHRPSHQCSDLPAEPTSKCRTGCGTEFIPFHGRKHDQQRKQSRSAAMIHCRTRLDRTTMTAVPWRCCRVRPSSSRRIGDDRHEFAQSDRMALRTNRVKPALCRRPTTAACAERRVCTGG